MERKRCEGGTVVLPEVGAMTGLLPVGRFPSTVDEVAGRFATTAHRQELWAEWLDATAILRSAVPIAFVWLGGSFLTSRDVPGDVDCVYWVEDVHFLSARRNPTAAGILEGFSTPGWVKEELKLRVDAFVVPWTCNPESAPTQPHHARYLRVRGYWDDFWLRARSGARGAAPVRQDALPRRGYVEVVFDGLV
jgi:hypothetical protein